MNSNGAEVTTEGGIGRKRSKARTRGERLGNSE